jgi:DNA-binding transcriptional MerR regulator
MNTPTSDDRRFSLDELAALASLPRRTVRYYIQQGLVDRPAGGGTRAAYYTPRHLEQLLTIAKWSEAGLSLERIRELLRGEAPPVPAPPRGTVEVRSHLLIADGVELVIEPGRAGLTPEQVRRLFREVLQRFESITNEDAADEAREYPDER